MSASREKKTRADQPVSADPKTAREQKERQEAHRSNVLYGTIAVLFLIVAIMALVWKSNIIPKHATAVTIDGEKYTAAEVDYHFSAAMQSFINQNYNYLSMLGLDPSKDLKSQSFGEQTWYDFFLEQGLTEMAQTKAMSAKAESEGFAWTDEMQAQVDGAMESLKATASQYGYSEKQYLAAVYNGGMTVSVYEELVKESVYVQSFLTEKMDSLTYEDAQIIETYQADPNAFDKVAYSSIRVSGLADVKDAEGNDMEVTEEMAEKAMADAKATANKLHASFLQGETMENAAESSDKAQASSNEGTFYTDTILGNWLFDSNRRAGDSTVLEDKDASCYYVVSFDSRYREEYPLVNVRHILIQPEATELAQEDEGYDADVAAKKAAAKAEAEEILAQWKSGEATEESFIALVKEHSADVGSVPDGGLIPDIAKDSPLVPPFLDWCFENGRAVADTGIVESDYGYHIMYLSSFGAPYWKAQVEASLVADEFNNWYDEIVADVEPGEQGFGMKFVG